MTEFLDVTKMKMKVFADINSKMAEIVEVFEEFRKKLGFLSREARSHRGIKGPP